MVKGDPEGVLIRITITHFVTSTLRVFDIGQTMVALHFIAFSVLAKK
jgi:hypothetical protein